jgi:hypothetical protein
VHQQQLAKQRELASQRSAAIQKKKRELETLFEAEYARRRDARPTNLTVDGLIAEI